MNDQDEKRLVEMYDTLVDNTENPTIYGNMKENNKLGFGLALLEYILGNTDDNPIAEHFVDAW